MGGNWLTTIGPLIIFFVIFYFLLIRPQQKRQKKAREMQTNVKRGDMVVTIGGIHGTVDAVDEDSITIKCNGTTKITFDKAALRTVTPKESNEIQS